MPKYVEMPDGKVVEFPDFMGDDMINKALSAGTEQKAEVQQTTNPLAGTTIGYWADTLQNVPKSAGDFAHALVSPFTDPVGFYEGMKTVATNPQARQAVVDLYKSRLSNPANTFQQDPVGFLGDISAVTGIGGLGSRLPGIAGRLAQGSSAVSGITDPLAIAGKVVGGTAKTIGNKAVAPALGTITGYSGEAVRTAFEGGKVFRDWMRGDQEATEILKSVKGAVDDMADTRRNSYNAGMKQLDQASQGMIVDINPVRTELNSRLKQFGVNVDPQTGKLDFSRVKGITPALEDDITQIYKKVNDWGNQAGDFTVNGMDTLKQQLDTHFSAIGMGDRIDAFLKPVKSKLVEQIEKTAPGYKGVLETYGKEIELQQVINTAFSTRNPRNVETAVKKVEQALKDNNSFRTQLVETMDSATGTQIKEMIAGYNMRELWPQSWLGRSADLTTIMAVMAGAISPKFLAMLMTSSPRIVGEFANIAGRAYALGSKARNFIPQRTVSAPAFQAGRMSQITQQEY